MSFAKVKNIEAVEKLIKERRALMNEANNRITLAAAGRTQEEFKSAKQAEKNLAPLTSLTKEVIDQLKLQTDDLEAIRQLSVPSPPARPRAKMPLPSPVIIVPQPSPQKQSKIVELFPNYKSDNPLEVLLKGLDNLKDHRTEIEIERDGDDFTINGESGFLSDDKVGLEKNNTTYPLTKGLAFLLAAPFSEFRARSSRGPKARKTKELFTEMLDSVTEEDAENYLQILGDTNYNAGSKKPGKYIFVNNLVNSPNNKEDIIKALVNKPRRGKGVENGEVSGELIPQKKSRPYRVEKIDNKMVFGDLTIDSTSLYTKMMLYAYDSDGNLAVKAKIDASFIDLLTKRFNTKKIYSQVAKRAFKKLMLASKLEPNMKSAKYKWLYDDQRGGQINAVSKASVMGFTLDELSERLPILLGEIKAGNNSDLIFNEAMRIMDILLNKGVITKNEHKGLFDRLMGLMRTAVSKI